MSKWVVVFASFTSAFAAVFFAWACVDVTPIVVENDAFDPNSSCRRCLESPAGCSDLISSCKANPVCLETYNCMIPLNCLDLRTIDDKIKCGLGCAQEAGVQSLDDPVTGLFFSFVSCGQQKCVEACNLVDANIGL